ncbi:MAG: hypothetical protein HKP61_20290 [Dactylosporangium sp.]|nr:hypothetical protein [Dactylosporangium sp.]NNJ63224.1 hypothetical protein [Dactylosporangium sp.]
MNEPARSRDKPINEPHAFASGAVAEVRNEGHHLPTTGQPAGWGSLAPAIRRWERMLGRPAPAPTQPGPRGRHSLSPGFVEWLMGLPAGHVTGLGLSRRAQLQALGNGVVPQQATRALRILLSGDDPGAAAENPDLRDPGQRSYPPPPGETDG